MRIPGISSSTDDLFQGLKNHSSLPERAQAYLALLAESTTSQGSMQKHLLHLAANAASRASDVTGLIAKTAGMVANPFDCLAQVLAEEGAFTVTAEVRKTGKHSWVKLRTAVMCAASFKTAVRRSFNDDSCLPDSLSSSSSSSEPLLNPIQAKFLQLCLGAIMSNVTMAVVQSSGVTPDVVHDLIPQAVDAVSHLLGGAAGEGLQHMAAAALDLTSQHASAALDAVGGAQDAQANSTGLGMDSLASATAARLLRADSKSRVILSEFGGEFKRASSLLSAFNALVDTVHPGGRGGGAMAAAHAHHAGGGMMHMSGVGGGELLSP